MHIGVISDTHGLLRASAMSALEACDLIIHAGDVGKEDILRELAAIAPLVAVRGNIDTGSVAEKLPDREVVEHGGLRLLVLHDLAELEVEFDPLEAGYRAVIFGHSHRPLIEARQDVLYFNPGSAGPRRFRLPVTVGRLTLKDGGITAEIVDVSEPREMPAGSAHRLIQAVTRAAKGMQGAAGKTTGAAR
ncbi:MAG: metallophosphoesterase family protein [Hyphomicrobiales bacterium]|nr:metallophosphoesterase family protein [Hyphomicrobiales bacterium]